MSSYGSKSARTPAGRIRLMSHRLANAVRRNFSLINPHDTRRPSRHNSMPLQHALSGSGYSPSSQPSSPKGSSSFFTPAMSIPLVRQSASTPISESGYPLHGSASAVNLGGSSTPISTSPPRSKAGRPFRPRTASAHSALPDSHALAMFTPSSQAGGSASGVNGGGSGGSNAGWNDPPMGMLSPQAHSRLTAEGGGGLGISGALSPGGQERALSRQSSRVNLSEGSLALRNSRAGTPAFDDHDA